LKKITIFTFLSLVIVSIVAMEIAANKNQLDQLGANIFGTSLDNLPGSLGEEMGFIEGIVRGTGEAQAEGEDVTFVGEESNGSGEIDLITVVDDQGPEIIVESNPVDLGGTNIFDDLITTANNAINTAETIGASDFEDVGFGVADVNVYVREEMIRSAGFPKAVLSEEDAKGYLFKNIYVGDLRNVNLKKFSVSENDQAFLKIYFFELSPLADATTTFETIKTQSERNLGTIINQTNEFASASFYVNDSNRETVAFLIVRFDQLIYAFSYPKQYHQQIKNLIRLIDYEF
jgi:hypothetical protein